MAAGCLSETDFHEAALAFVGHSNEIDGGWELKTAQNQLYLFKREVKLPISSDQSHGGIDEEYLELQTTAFEQPEAGVLDTSGAEQEFLTYEYHVVYSASYAVPVLFFNIYKPGGELVSMERVWSMVPQQYQLRLQQERWTFLTQQEHPLLNQPYFQLHPCHTESLMQQQQLPGNQQRQQHSCLYLTRWLSAVGPVVGLQLPLSYAKLAPANLAATEEDEEEEEDEENEEKG